MKNELMSYRSTAKRMNDRVYTNYVNRLSLIARSVFEWNGLEELGIDEKWIEKYLFRDGACVFYRDPIFGIMVARMNPAGNYNHYDEPTVIQPYATGYTYEGETLINKLNCVIIRNNDDMLPTLPTIELYAMKLTNIDRTIDVNIQAQKMPIIIKCSDKQKLTLKQVILQRDDNEPVIFGDKSLDTTEMEVLNTGAPIVFDKLELQKHMIWNECMTMLGVNNSNQDKKERLVDDEVQANNEQVEINYEIMLKARELACEQINKLFGTHISVKKRVENIDIVDSDASNGSELDSEVV